MYVNRGFPEVDHSSSSARTVSEENKFSKKLPLIRIKSMTLRLHIVLTSHLYSLMPSQLSYLGKLVVLIQGSLTLLLFMHQLTFGLG